MNGWFKFWRAMLNHPVWHFSPGQFKAWITCLALANHQPGEWWDGEERVEIPAGSFITSQPHLAEAAGVGRQVIRDTLRHLQQIGSITTKIQTKRWTLIEIVNWPIYQGDKEQENQEGNLPGTKGEPSGNHNGRREEGKKDLAGALPASAGKDGKGPKPGRKPRTTHPDTDKLLAEFGVLYRQKFETDYLASFARDKKMLHDMLNLSGAEEVRARMTAFLKYGTKWTRERGNYSIPAFRLAWNELGVLKARGDL